MGVPTYQRRTRIEAPLEIVWEFHSNPSGLEALTPAWMQLRIDAVVGPDGERDPPILEAGSELDVSLRPFDVGPRSRWTSAIVERHREAGAAYFRDEMVRGPFERWEHTHAFFADGEATVLLDHLEYELPGPLGSIPGSVSQLGFEPMFRYRHRRTKELLEGENVRNAEQRVERRTR